MPLVLSAAVVCHWRGSSKPNKAKLSDINVLLGGCERLDAPLDESHSRLVLASEMPEYTCLIQRDVRHRVYDEKVGCTVPHDSRSIQAGLITLHLELSHFD